MLNDKTPGAAGLAPRKSLQDAQYAEFVGGIKLRNGLPVLQIGSRFFSLLLGYDCVHRCRAAVGKTSGEQRRGFRRQVSTTHSVAREYLETRPIAHGALRAARWLAKKKPGLYAMQNMLGLE